jgi:hypothetical protein
MGRSAQGFERGLRQTVGIVSRLRQVRRRWREHNDAGYARSPVACQIVYDLAARHRMANHGEILQILLGDHRGEVVSECIVVVAVECQVGAPVSASIEVDAAIPCRAQADTARYEDYPRAILPERLKTRVRPVRMAPIPTMLPIGRRLPKKR